MQTASTMKQKEIVMVTKKQVDEAYDKAYAAQEAAREACAWAEAYLNRYHKLKREYNNENGK